MSETLAPRRLGHEERQALRQLVSARRRELMPVDDGRDRDAELDARLARRAAQSTIEAPALLAETVRPATLDDEDDLGEDLDTDTDTAARREAFVQAIREMEAGRRRMATALAGAAERYALSLREVEVLALVAEGYRNEEIAEALRISPDTVKSHVRRILLKMRARNRSHAVALASGFPLTGDPESAIVATEAAA